MNKKSVCKTLLFALLLAALLGLCAGASAQVIEECTSINHVGPIIEVNRVSATCTVNGSVQKKCQNCGVIIATEPIIAQGHVFCEQTVHIYPATCTSTGLDQVVRKCSVTTCGYVESTRDVPLPPLGHNLGAAVTVQAATCTANGISRKSCTRGCGYYEDTTIPALGHQLGTPVTVQAATCTADGISRKSCTRGCGYYQDTAIPALGHLWGAPVTKPATCVSPATTTKTCQRDSSHKDVTETGDVDLVNGHDWGDWTVTRKATCMEPAQETRICKLSSAHAEIRAFGDPDPIDGHKWDSGVVTKEPTATEDGEILYTCELHSSHTMRILLPAGYSIENGVITAYNGASAELVIPSEIGGKTITGIGESAFAGNTVLTSVTIPNGVTSIGDQAFSECENLSSINIPHSVTSIGEDAFQGCGGLTILCEAGSEAEAYAMENHISCDYPGQDPQDFTFAALTETTCKIKKYSGSASGVVIPSQDAEGRTVTHIGAGAFANKSLISIIIPDGVTSIDDNAFENCQNLKNVIISSSMATIGDSAFMACYALPGMTIPEGVTSIGDSAFAYCGSLASIVIPATVTDFGEDVFYGCRSLTIICEADSAAEDYAIANNIPYDYIPTEDPDLANYIVENGIILGYTGESTELVIPSEINGETIIGVDEFAFMGNTDLTSISLPSSVTAIGDYAFSGCSGLSEITLPSGLTSIGNCVFKGCSSLNNLGIPSGVTSIGSSAFKDCASLTEIILPSNLTSIGSHAFESCSGLTGITIPNTVTSLGTYAFTKCTGLTSATLPTGITVLADGLFNGCKFLGSIDIPAGVTSIGYYAFNGCTGLTSVTIPQGVTTIAYSAFDSCTGLSSIEIPDTVTDIGIFAFFNCTNLTSAVIPASVTSIGSQAFGGCSGLTIYGAPGSCAETYATGNNIPFAESMTCAHEWGKPTATLPPTKTEKGSAERFCILCGEKDVMEIPALNEMNTLYLPAALTAIEDEAFYLVAADAIIVPDGCTSIGENAFASSSIIYIRVPAGVTIPETAFDGCFGHLVVDTGE